MNPAPPTANTTTDTAPPPAAPAPALQAPPRSMDSATLLDLIIDDQDKRDIVQIEIDTKRFEYHQRIAGVMWRAKYFTSLESLDQALAKIEIGRAWRMNPADSIRFIFVVNGKPSIENEYYAAKMQDSGWGWDVEWIGSQGADCKGVRLWLFKDGKPLLDRASKHVFVEFTEEMAKGIIVQEKENRICILQKKGPWSDGWRGNMMYWRCIAQVRRFHCPNILTGALLRDEMQDIRAEDFEVADRRPETQGPLPDKIDTVLKRRSRVSAPATADESANAPGPAATTTASAVAERTPTAPAVATAPTKTADERYNDTARQHPTQQDEPSKQLGPTPDPQKQPAPPPDPQKSASVLNPLPDIGAASASRDVLNRIAGMKVSIGEPQWNAIMGDHFANSVDAIETADKADLILKAMRAKLAATRKP